MEPIRSRAWYTTDSGDDRGYIQPHRLKELWFHTGTACNLSCDFCLEGSGPGDKRLELVRLADVKPLVDEAVALGVEQFSFTGGEPFLAKELPAILEYASRFAPCLVLTNGTEALHKRIEHITGLAGAEHPISFRISIDYPDAKRHDEGRGKGMFDQAMQGLSLLNEKGFHVSVARQMKPDENKSHVDSLYQQLFALHQLPEDLHIVAFPDFLPPGSEAEVPAVTTHCMTAYQTEEGRKNFMCAFSKMVVRKNGKMRVYACTLVDDDPEYDLGPTLADAMPQRISMKHHRCFSCFKYGASCSEV